MATKTRIVVIGCGAVGTMCAYTLQNSGRVSMTTVLRSNHDSVVENGFQIQSVDHGNIKGWKPHHITKTAEEAIPLGPFDFVVVALKNLPDVYSLSAIISPLVTPSLTSIVLVQNGIAIEQDLVDSFPHNTVISGVPMIGCEKIGNKIIHNDPDVLFVGSFPEACREEQQQQRACTKFARLYSQGGAKCIIKENITWYRWRKLLWNASFNSICALTVLDSGAVQEAQAITTLIRPIMDEVVAVARKAGHEMPPGIQDEMIAFTPKEARLKPSMQVDMMNRRPMEIEAILGNTQRIGERLGVSTPLIKAVYDILKVKQWSFLHDV